jgi:hypothetical protein
MVVALDFDDDPVRLVARVGDAEQGAALVSISTSRSGSGRPAAVVASRKSVSSGDILPTRTRSSARSSFGARACRAPRRGAQLIDRGQSVQRLRVPTLVAGNPHDRVSEDHELAHVQHSGEHRPCRRGARHAESSSSRTVARCGAT